MERTRSIAERVRQSSAAPRERPTGSLPEFVLPSDKSKHFCTESTRQVCGCLPILRFAVTRSRDVLVRAGICNHQSPSSLSNRAALLGRQLTELGYEVVCPGSEDDLQAAVLTSVCLLIFLGGEGGSVFGSTKCQRLIEHAKFEEIPIVFYSAQEVSVVCHSSPTSGNKRPMHRSRLAWASPTLGTVL